MSPEEASPFQLTAGQAAALSGLVAAIVDPDRKQYKALLEGWAGTGKTFTINRIVEEVKRVIKGINFGMTAPTHKAVRQLRKHSELKDSLDFGTIHSFLGLKEVLKPDPKDPTKMIVKYELDWESSKERRIDNIDVLIVDEASMLGDELYEHIEDVCKLRTDLKVIFMGDNLQIPPVGKKQETGTADAIPFVPEQRKTRRIEHFVLSEVVRQKGTNPIIDYSRTIREQVRHQKVSWNPMASEPGTGVEILRKEDGITQLRKLFLEYFKTDAFEQDPDYIKVIAWRNNTVDYFNKEIRTLLRGSENLPRIMEGEKLIMNKPVLKGDKILIANNEELFVTEVRIEDYPLKYKFIDTNAFANISSTERSKEYREEKLEVYRCVANLPDGKKIPIIILHEDCLKRFDQIKESLADAAKKLNRRGQIFEGKDMWKEFYLLEKHFAWVGYNYCVTAHKSQGSTYDYCISMEWDIDQNRDIEERNRIRYVAATRARHKLFIVK